MTSAIDTFIEDARAVTIGAAALLLGLDFKKSSHEHPQACPACGGVDRFSFNTKKNIWNCRGEGIGGHDAIGMAAHILGFDLKSREGFLDACSAVLGRPIPEGGAGESEEEKAARLARLEDRRRKNAAEAEKRERDHIDFREKERRRARGIYEAAARIIDLPVPPDESGSIVDYYLRYRGCATPPGRWLRFSADVTYWHGQDERGQPLSLHVGPAMIAPFIDSAGIVIGCHITWIDLDNPPKLRPLLADLETGEPLPTKKMRGSKKGGIIPLAGDFSARRWLGGEGIENTLAIGRHERFRGDTFYFAAGDLGNMAGKADPKSRFAHPNLTKPDKLGRERPVMVAGPVPMLQDGGEPDAMVIPGHVDELVLLADGDSEPVMTAAAMVRAKLHHWREGRLIPVVWPRPGTDFAAMLAGADEAYELDGAAA